MSRIGFLGLGAMGARMAQRLIGAGNDVTVWNRTSERTQALVQLGANVADSPRSAAKDADFVISMVRDDEASRYVWLEEEHGALQSLASDAIAVECSTLSIPYVRELNAAFTAAKRILVDAPVAGSRPQAEAGDLIFFVGASTSTYEQVRVPLESLAKVVHHAGTTGTGATIKLMVNALFGAQLGVVAELLGFAEKAGVDPSSAFEILGSTPVCSPAARLAASAMIAGAWEPAFPINLVAKDFALLDRSAQSLSSDLPLCRRTGEIYASGVQKGIGADNINGIAQLYSNAKA